MATKITNHVDLAKQRLLFQYKDVTNINALLEVLVSEFQVLEDLFYDDLLNLVSITNATGDMLDNIGALVGQDRIGLDDADYRVLIRAKIGENVSEGDAEKIITVFNIITQTTNNMLIENFPAEVQLLTSATLSATIQAIIYDLIDEVLGAGIGTGAIIHFDTDSFIFDTAVGTPTTLGDGFSDTAQLLGGRLAEII